MDVDQVKQTIADRRKAFLRFIPVFHVSRRLQGYFGSFIVVLCGAAGVLIAMDWSSVSGTWIPLACCLLCLPSILVVAQSRHEAEACIMCLRGRREVQFLVAGESAAICDECAYAAVGAFAERSAPGAADDFFRHVLRALPRHYPLRMSGPLLKILASGERTPDELRWIGGQASLRFNPALAARLYARIPEGDRTDADWINLGVALKHEARFEEAMMATAKAATVSSPTNPFVLHNLAAIAETRNKSASEAEMKGWLADVLEARRIWEEEGTPVSKWALESTLGQVVDLRRRLGDFEGAEAALAKAEEQGHLREGSLIARARVRIEQNRLDEASKDLDAAFRLVPPDSPFAAEIGKLRLRIESARKTL